MLNSFNWPCLVGTHQRQSETGLNLVFPFWSNNHIKPLRQKKQKNIHNSCSPQKFQPTIMKECTKGLYIYEEIRGRQRERESEMNENTSQLYNLSLLQFDLKRACYVVIGLEPIPACRARRVRKQPLINAGNMKTVVTLGKDSDLVPFREVH